MEWVRIFGARIADVFEGRITLIWTKNFAWTGYKNMRNLIGLIDAICEAYDDPQLIPKNGETYCNFAVAAIADAIGCKDFHLKTADEILAHIETNPDWSDVPMVKAQEMANAGSLLIAGLDSRALNQAHGHVCVIRPGKVCYSGKWGAVPRVLNIGAENFLARAKKGPLTGMSCGLNEAFRDMPMIWVWRPSL